jgi:hypothetical protein
MYNVALRCILATNVPVEKQQVLHIVTVCVAIVIQHAMQVLVGKTEEKRPFGRPGVDGRIILRWIFRKRLWGMDWIYLAQDRDMWQALLNAVMNLWVS